MDPETLEAIRQGGAPEIISLFKKRADLAQQRQEIEGQVTTSPELRSTLNMLNKEIRGIDNYLKDKLEPVCKVDGNVIYGYADQCRTINRIGCAPGDIDVSESGARFINPALPGWTMWGVPAQTQDREDVMPPMTMWHVDRPDSPSTPDFSDL